jgi:CheY-like chemotaxis protein
MLQLLQAGASPKEQSTFAHMAYDAARRLLFLLNDILDFSRLEAGRINLTSAPFQLQDIFDSMENVFRLTCMSKMLELVSSIEGDVPRQLLGDEARLRQVLFNLVGNAIKFTPAGGVRVEAWINRSPLAQELVHLYIRVSDTGIGIPDDKIDHVFQRFTQTDASYTRRYEGAGLGLAIVKRLVQLLGGDITVDSTLGQGTSIYLHLPLALVPEETVALECAEPEAADDGGELRILVAEDELVSQLAIKTQLTRMGHNVVCVSNGREAVEAARQAAFDCILMDIQMPEMNGVEATEQIRRIQKPLGRSGVWIIALTAYALAGDKDKFLAAGLNDYISKPVQQEQLAAVLRRVVRQRTLAKH